jgi:hypothetical protein
MAVALREAPCENVLVNIPFTCRACQATFIPLMAESAGAAVACFATVTSERQQAHGEHTTHWSRSGSRCRYRVPA